MSLKQPVRYPAKYYSHLDAGAPQLADVDGVIKTILKACLVTGYGTKESAGWTSLFEDDYRIVLRRPLGVGNAPDIKVENGVINGTAKHRIVSQNNPTGLNDAVELAATNLLARDSSHGQEWHLVACDFGFIFCHQMGGGGLNQAVFVTETIMLDEAKPPIFAASHLPNIGYEVPGTLRSALNRPLMDNQHLVKNLLTDANYDSKYYLQLPVVESFVTGVYVAQRVIVNSEFLLPFYISLTRPTASIKDRQVSIDGRPALRFLNDSTSTAAKSLYIPIDYWEL